MMRLMMALLIVAVGCDESPTGCDPCRTTVIVYGNMRTGDGVELSRVRFDLLTFSSAGCDRGSIGIGSGYTNELGEYRVLISSLFSPHTARCIQFAVNPDSVPGVPTDTVHLPMDLDFRPLGEAQDSVRLDVVVPATP